MTRREIMLHDMQYGLRVLKRIVGRIMVKMEAEEDTSLDRRVLLEAHAAVKRLREAIERLG